MAKYVLRMAHDEELLGLGENQEVQVGHLFITSTILEAIVSFREKETLTINEFNQMTSEVDTKIMYKQMEHYLRRDGGLENFPSTSEINFIYARTSKERPLASFGLGIDYNSKLLKEINLLRHAVVNWIDKKSFPDLPDDTTSIDAEARFKIQQNLCDSPMTPWIFGKTFRIHRSESLLCLAWAEVWYAIENNIRARYCPYCGKVFILPPNNPHKASCGEKTCKRAYEIERHGGIDAYREWDRNRKKVDSKRSPGRPKKETPATPKRKAGRPRKEG